MTEKIGWCLLGLAALMAALLFAYFLALASPLTLLITVPLIVGLALACSDAPWNRRR